MLCKINIPKYDIMYIHLYTMLINYLLLSANGFKDTPII